MCYKELIEYNLFPLNKHNIATHSANMLAAKFKEDIPNTLINNNSDTSQYNKDAA